MRQMGATGVDADKSQLPRFLVFLQDLVGDPGNGAPELVGGNDCLNKNAAHASVQDTDSL